MTQRERFLGLTVAGALVALGGFSVAKWAIYEPFQNVRNAIKKEQSSQTKLNDELVRLAHVEIDWQDLTRKTLAIQPGEAERRFREDIHALLEMHALRDPKVTPGTYIPYKSELVGVPLTISAHGTLKNIVGFLTDFYRNPYLSRIDKLTISAEAGVIDSVNAPRGRRRNEPATSGDPDLRLSMQALTVVLPRLPDIDQPVLGEIARTDTVRDTVLAMADYQPVIESNLFKPYVQAPPPPPPPPPPTKDPNDIKPPTRIDPIPTKPDHRRVAGTGSLNGHSVVYVIDDGALGPATAYYNDSMVDEEGWVLLILPQGMVLRTDDGGHVADYFYPLGAGFEERQLLDPEVHPDVWQALEQEFVNWDGDQVDSPAGSATVNAG